MSLSIRLPVITLALLGAGPARAEGEVDIGPGDALLSSPEPAPPAPASSPPAVPRPLPAPAQRPAPETRYVRVHDPVLLAALQVGLAYQQMFTSHALAGAAELHLGSDFPSWDIGARIGIRGGETLAGLPVFIFAVGPEVARHVSRRVRFGIGLDLGTIVIGKTVGTSRFLGPYFALHPDLWIDLDRLGKRGTLYLHLRASGEMYRSDLLPSFGAQTNLGYRF